MSGEQKQSILDDFSNGTVQVLVATTVIEVGIDVANATVMTILDADRMGLAQLHQLRGRIARSAFPGYLCVFARQNADPNENARLAALASTDDGFELAELIGRCEDLEACLGHSKADCLPLNLQTWSEIRKQ